MESHNFLMQSLFFWSWKFCFVVWFGHYVVTICHYVVRFVGYVLYFHHDAEISTLSTKKKGGFRSSVAAPMSGAGATL